MTPQNHSNVALSLISVFYERIFWCGNILHRFYMEMNSRFSVNKSKKYNIQL